MGGKILRMCSKYIFTNSSTFSILFHFCQDHFIPPSHFICTSCPLQQPGLMLLFFQLEFFTTTASVAAAAAAATTTGFTGICLSDVLSSLTEKHNLGLIGVSSCKELHYDYSHNAQGNVSYGRVGCDYTHRYGSFDWTMGLS